MSFSDVRDQAIPIRLLRNILARKRIPNGLLFWGAGGVGKGLTGMELAKAINCREAEADACDSCLSCRKIAHGNHADVKVITPSGRTRIINVETVDFMSELTAYRPFESEWRVFLIQEADRMGVPAQNHFLKTLEEPPSNTLFILLTEFPRVLLPTIRSRCQQVRFGALRPETVRELLLRDRDLLPDHAEAIAAVSQGQMARALDLVESEKRDTVLDVAQRLSQGEDPLILGEEFVARMHAQEETVKAAVKAEFDTSETAGGSKEDQEEAAQAQLAHVEGLIRRDRMEYLYLLKTWYRDALVYRVTQDPAQVLNRDHLERLQDVRAEDLEGCLAAIEKAWVYLERNLRPDRIFRDLFFALS